jgi:hypothetical protein
MIDRDLLIKAVPEAAGAAASGLVGGLLLALTLAPALALVVVAAALAGGRGVRQARWRRVVIGMLATVLLALSAEFAGEEPAYWYRTGVVALAFLGLVLALLALPIAWWRGRARRRSRPQTPAGAAVPVARPERPGVRLLAAAFLLASTVVAALLKQRVYPEPLAWSAVEACGLALVAVPFAFLLGRAAFPRRRGTGVLTLAGTIALGGWLSLAARPLLVGQTRAAMRELAAVMAELTAGEEVKPRAYDRWRYGQCAPLVQGMSRFYRRVQASLRALDGLEPVLTGDSFRDPAALQATEARLAALRQRLATLDAEVGRSARTLRRQIEEASISSEMRGHLLAGLDDGLAGGPQRLTGSLAPLLDVLERIVAFMKLRRGRYHLEGSEVVFESDADAVSFNRLLDDLQREQDRLLGVVAANQIRARDKAEEFDAWAQDPFNRPRPRRE